MNLHNQPRPFLLLTLGTHMKYTARLGTSTIIGIKPWSLPQLAKSGLAFYGLSPYQDHLPLGHPENAAAVKWLTGEQSEISPGGTTAEEADTLPR